MSAGLVVTVGVRVVLAGLGVAVLLVPLPALTGNPAAGVAVFALPVPFIVAWRPGSAWVTVLLVVAVLTWVVTSLFEGAPPAALTIGFGCLLYLAHSTAAFAAALPPVKRIEPLVVVMAMLRVAAVLACCVPLMLAVLLAPPMHGSAFLALIGAVSALGVAAMLAVLALRARGD